MKISNKIIWTLLLSTLIASLLLYVLPTPEVNDVDERYFWVSKTFSSPANIVIGGDSRSFRGVNSNLLSASGEVTAINLGYSSAGFSADYLNFLSSKIDTTDKNGVIIIGVTPHSLTPSAFENEQLLEYKSTSKFDRISLTYLQPILRLIPSYNAAELKRYFFDKNDGTIILNQTFAKTGWVGTSRVPVDTTLALESYERVFINNQVSQENINILTTTCKEIIDTGTKIVAYRPPTSGQLRLLEDSLSGFDEADVKGKLIQAGVIWLEVDHSAFDSYDGSHLDKKSANLFTQFLWDSVFSGLVKNTY